MGRFWNFAFGGTLILLGIGWLIALGYIGIKGDLGINDTTIQIISLLVGVLIIAMSLAKDPTTDKRHWMGIIIGVFVIIVAVSNFIPFFTDYVIYEGMQAIALLIFGAILILMYFKKTAEYVPSGLSYGTADSFREGYKNIRSVSRFNLIFSALLIVAGLAWWLGGWDSYLMYILTGVLIIGVLIAMTSKGILRLLGVATALLALVEFITNFEFFAIGISVPTGPILIGIGVLLLLFGMVKKVFGKGSESALTLAPPGSEPTSFLGSSKAGPLTISSRKQFAEYSAQQRDARILKDEAQKTQAKEREAQIREAQDAKAKEREAQIRAANFIPPEIARKMARRKKGSG